MRTVQRAAAVMLLTMVGCATPPREPGPGTPGWLGPDLSRVRVTSAVPAPAPPPHGYAETVAWLAAYTRRHGHGSLTIGEKKITAQSDLIATRYDCVLLHTLTIEAASTGRHTTIAQVLSMPSIRLSSVEVSSQTGRSGCVNFEGDDGVVVEIQLAPVVERSRSREGAVCFDSQDAAREAAKALAHVATLCGAR